MGATVKYSIVPIYICAVIYNRTPSPDEIASQNCCTVDECIFAGESLLRRTNRLQTIDVHQVLNHPILPGGVRVR